MVDKTRIIDLYLRGGTFTSVFRKFKGGKKDYNTADLSMIRHLLTNEKARLLHVVKVNQPKSLYALAKFLERDFKTVREDVLLLKKFGFLDLIEEKSGNRRTHKPIITTNSVSIIIRI